MKRLAIILVLGVMTFGLAIYGYNFMQVRGLLAEAKQLSASGKYNDAIGKLELAQDMWSFASTKYEVWQELTKNEKLAGSSNNFGQGKIQYDEGNYERAVEYFYLVLPEDVNYEIARSYIELANKKLSDIKDYESKGSVAGTSTQTYASPVSIPTVTPTPTLTPIPTQSPAAQALPTQIPNVDGLCQSKANLAVIEFRKRAREIIWNTSPPGTYIGDVYQKEAALAPGTEQIAQQLYYQIYSGCLKGEIAP